MAGPSLESPHRTLKMPRRGRTHLLTSLDRIPVGTSFRNTRGSRGESCQHGHTLLCPYSTPSEGRATARGSQVPRPAPGRKPQARGAGHPAAQRAWSPSQQPGGQSRFPSTPSTRAKPSAPLQGGGKDTASPQPTRTASHRSAGLANTCASHLQDKPMGPKEERSCPLALGPVPPRRPLPPYGMATSHVGPSTRSVACRQPCDQQQSRFGSSAAVTPTWPMTRRWGLALSQTDFPPTRTPPGGQHCKNVPGH